MDVSDGLLGKCVGPLDNTRLAAEDNVHALRMGVQENEDYGVITDAAWDLIVGWYGGGPQFKRSVTTVGIRVRLTNNQSMKSTMIHLLNGGVICVI
jgi:hypothetical protein